MKLIKTIISVLTPIEVAIKKISKQDANLMVADIAMTTCLSELGCSEIAKKCEKKLLFAPITRIEDRRGIFSDILWRLRGNESIFPAYSNLFFQRPSDELIFELTNYLNFSSDACEPINILDLVKNPKIMKMDQGHTQLLDFLLTIKPSRISSERAFSVCSRIDIPVR